MIRNILYIVVFLLIYIIKIFYSISIILGDKINLLSICSFLFTSNNGEFELNLSTVFSNEEINLYFDK